MQNPRKHNQRGHVRAALIGAIAVIIAALIGGVFVLFSPSSTQQTTHCGSAVNSVNGNVTINSNQDCKETTL